MKFQAYFSQEMNVKNDPVGVHPIYSSPKYSPLHHRHHAERTSDVMRRCLPNPPVSWWFCLFSNTINFIIFIMFYRSPILPSWLKDTCYMTGFCVDICQGSSAYYKFASSSRWIVRHSTKMCMWTFLLINNHTQDTIHKWGHFLHSRWTIKAQTYPPLLLRLDSVHENINVMESIDKT